MRRYISSKKKRGRPKKFTQDGLPDDRLTAKQQEMIASAGNVAGIYISKEVIRHEKCKTQVDFLGAFQNLEGQELRFYCLVCAESIWIPVSAVKRIRRE